MGLKGRPSGLPKSGGRQKGVKNKPNPKKEERRIKIRLDRAFFMAGFDIASEFISAYNQLDASQRIDALRVILPYAAPRIQEVAAEKETDATTAEAKEVRNKKDEPFLRMLVNAKGK